MIKQLILYILLFILLFPFGTELISQEDETQKIEGEGVTIYGKGNSEKESNTPGSATILYPSKINSRSKNATELLALLPGIGLVKNGSANSIVMRGASAHQLKVYVNGIPVDDPSFGTTDLDSIPISSIERIEIYRSHAPVEFNSPGLGGVINIVTRSLVSQRRASVGYGSFNRKQFSYSALELLPVGAYSFALAAKESKNNFEYLNNNGTPVVNKADDFTETRKNNSVSSVSLDQGLRFANSKYRLYLYDSFSFSKNGVPGLDSVQNETVYQTDSENRTGAELSLLGLLHSTNEFTFKSFYSIKEDELSDEKNEVYTEYSRVDNVYEKTGFSLYGISPLFADSNVLELNIGWVGDSYKRSVGKNNGNNQTYPRQFRSTVEGALGDTLEFDNRRGLLSLQFRSVAAWNDYYDEYLYSVRETEKRNDSQISDYGYSAGARYYFVENVFFLRGNFTRAYRIPLFSELFGIDSVSVGNEDLESEITHTSDAGFGLTVGVDEMKMSLYETVFHSYIENVILYTSNSQLTLIPLNTKAARIYGSETSLRLEAFRFSALGASYTYQEAKDESGIPYYNGKYLPHRPVHDLNSFFEVFGNGLRLTYLNDFTGFTFRDRANSEFYYRDYSLLHDIHFSASYNDDLMLAMEANNICDERTSDITGYPLPGRSFYVEISYTY
jgi:iron complex outermembrane receptor protein